MRYPILRSSRPILPALAALALLSAGAASADPAGSSTTVTLRSSQASAGLGWTWGHGVIEWRGERRAFRTRGLTLGQVGGAYGKVRGRVEGLRELDDFAGTFAVAEAGATMGAGRRYVAWRNEHGVVVTLTADEAGLLMGLGGAFLHVELADSGAVAAVPSE